jgi:hypothetical protein
MFKPTSTNRRILKSFLESISEDEFIEKIVIPIFSKNGYILYRINSHGPGEHGKDLIFYRNVPVFYDHEFIIVQAKSEKVTSSNVGNFSQQLVRALRVPFPTKTGKTERQANYVIFMNSMPHTNDSNFEFPYLIDGSNNIKILSQENMIELIIQNDILPEELKDKIETYDFETQDYEKEIKDIILSDDKSKIKFLFNTRLKIDSDALSNPTKKLIINYIFHKWDEDRTWAGTKIPMKWLNLYFNFIQESQYPKLFQVFEEYSSSTHSFDAYPDTRNIVEKTTSEQIKSFEEKFIDLVANKILNYNFKDTNLLFEKLNDFIKSGLIDEKFIQVGKAIKTAYDIKTKLKRKAASNDGEKLKKKLNQQENKIYEFLKLK